MSLAHTAGVDLNPTLVHYYNLNRGFPTNVPVFYASVQTRVGFLDLVATSHSFVSQPSLVFCDPDSFDLRHPEDCPSVSVGLTSASCLATDTVSRRFGMMGRTLAGGGGFLVTSQQRQHGNVTPFTTW